MKFESNYYDSEWAILGREILMKDQVNLMVMSAHRDKFPHHTILINPIKALIKEMIRKNVKENHRRTEFFRQSQKRSVL